MSVSGNDSSRVFEVETGLNVTINGLTITHGYAPDQGGGILNDGSNLTLSGDPVPERGLRKRHQRGRGGALLSLDGTLTISDCQITGNRALGAAGASAFGDAFGGGLYVLAGSATISNSTISGNLAREVTTAATVRAWLGVFLPRYRRASPAAPLATTWPAEAPDTPDNGSYGAAITSSPHPQAPSRDAPSAAIRPSAAMAGPENTSASPMEAHH